MKTITLNHFERYRSAMTQFQVPLLDPEDRACHDFDIVNSASPSGNVGEFDVINPRRHIGDAQMLIRVDRAILVVLTLVGTPVRRARRRQIKFRDRIPGHIQKLRRAVSRLCRARCGNERRDGDNDTERALPHRIRTLLFGW
jgi:chloramphenicol 3-O-phosphotransferase